MAINFPDINPIIISFGNSPFKVTWYSLAYLGGILLSWAYIRYLNKEGISKAIANKLLDDLISWLIFGIIIGGRIGYVLFYDLQHNLLEPLNIFKTWEGGMSFHGGLAGVIIANVMFCQKHKINILQVFDLLAAATPIGLFLGRIANFINGELYGRVTDVAWGVIFKGENFTRHPSQLYEALAEGILLFLILFILITKTKIQKLHGMLAGLFLLFYALFRAIIENYREPDYQLGFIYQNLTMGQILSLPMIVTGIILVCYAYFKKQINE